VDDAVHARLEYHLFQLTAETPFSHRLELHMFQAAAEMAF
jgi:hypothetical protein